MKHLIKKASPAFGKFYKIDGEILEAEQKMYAGFRRVHGLGYMTVSEMLETMHNKNYLSFLMWYTYPCSDTYYITFYRTIIQCVAQI